LMIAQLNKKLFLAHGHLLLRKYAIESLNYQ